MGKKDKNKQPNKIRKVFTIILDVLFVTVSVCLFLGAGVLFYAKVYLDPFLVNGESMYPTLNGEVYINGELTDGTHGRTQAGYENVEYGVMDTHQSAIKKIKRFDIVVTRYSETDAVDKIKRVVGVPGDTIKFVSSNDTTNGDFYVKQGGEYVLVEQPIENKYKVAGDYSVFNTIGSLTLAEDEYFVLGDNRGNSSDCLDLPIGKMAIKRDWIQAKAIAIVGHGTAAIDDGGNMYLEKIKYCWPRFL